jgi:hypothetical protein
MWNRKSLFSILFTGCLFINCALTLRPVLSDVVNSLVTPIPWIVARSFVEASVLSVILYPSVRMVNKGDGISDKKPSSK